MTNTIKVGSRVYDVSRKTDTDASVYWLLTDPRGARYTLINEADGVHASCTTGPLTPRNERSYHTPSHFDGYTFQDVAGVLTVTEDTEKKAALDAKAIADAAKAKSYSIGDVVEIHAFGRWYTGTVTKIARLKVTANFMTGIGANRNKACDMDHIRKAS